MCHGGVWETYRRGPGPRREWFCCGDEPLDVDESVAVLSLLFERVLYIVEDRLLDGHRMERRISLDFE